MIFRKLFGSFSCQHIVRQNNFANFQHYFLQKVASQLRNRNLELTLKFPDDSNCDGAIEKRTRRVPARSASLPVGSVQVQRQYQEPPVGLLVSSCADRSARQHGVARRRNRRSVGVSLASNPRPKEVTPDCLAQVLAHAGISHERDAPSPRGSCESVELGKAPAHVQVRGDCRLPANYPQTAEVRSHSEQVGSI